MVETRGLASDWGCSASLSTRIQLARTLYITSRNFIAVVTRW
jgi:hypothetical protein